MSAPRLVHPPPRSRPAPLCADCGHVVKLMMYPWECSADARGEPRLTDGRQHIVYHTASRERRSDRTLFGRLKCGPEGRFFEPALPPKPPIGGSAVIPPRPKR